MLSARGEPVLCEWPAQVLLWAIRIMLQSRDRLLLPAVADMLQSGDKVLLSSRAHVLLQSRERLLLSAGTTMLRPAEKPLRRYSDRPFELWKLRERLWSGR